MGNQQRVLRGRVTGSDVNFEVALAAVWSLNGRVGGKVMCRDLLGVFAVSQVSGDRSKREGRENVGRVLVVRLGWRWTERSSWI